ncbi:hypothetical protein [Clostridium botulinum]|uniref:hypothetical protein n=1 Tax=Clostridium botulinum TaxID=1491 RepID=UPI0004DA7AC3|nr:hypothetical protein [Clostridium botulinum]KEI06855.1 hypothetical protein Z952_02905 [Clostridium botulinum C/D str. BKT75002]KEI11610.1 hypothetical protein Z954_07540 [Clostridium botulinum C/D str. BKT2873]MCD3351689.1 hypothetical protein [Clostridium botulinum D/C]MCD3360589.1 hypothetical protein [Clostridium botulinum D/C]MCD3363787.1 hypothetical protein [Clostridium botulinum D/C]
MKIRDYIENKRVTIKPISFFYIKKSLGNCGLSTQINLDNLYLYKTILNTINLSIPQTFPNLSDISEEISPIIYNKKTIKLEERLKNLLSLLSNLKEKKFVYVNKNEINKKIEYQEDGKILFKLYCDLGYDRQERVNLEKLTRCIEYYISIIQEVLIQDIDKFSSEALIDKEDVKYISYVHDQLSTNDKKYEDIDEFMRDCFLSIDDLKVDDEYKVKLKEILISISLPCIPSPNIMINKICYSMHAFRHDIRDNIEYLIEVVKR